MKTQPYGKLYATCMSHNSLTQPYALQVFTYAQVPYDKAFTWFILGGFLRCSCANPQGQASMGASLVFQRPWPGSGSVGALKPIFNMAGFGVVHLVGGPKNPWVALSEWIREKVVCRPSVPKPTEVEEPELGYPSLVPQVFRVLFTVTGYLCPNRCRQDTLARLYTWVRRVRSPFWTEWGGSEGTIPLRWS